MTAVIPILTSQEAARIAAIAGRLSSNHDGEVLNAARLLVRTIGKHGMRPEELIASALAPQPVRLNAPAAPPPVRPRREHQRLAAECLNRGLAEGLWSEREEAFLFDMVSWRSPSSAQTEWLTSLVQRARAARGAA